MSVIRDKDRQGLALVHMPPYTSHLDHDQAPAVALTTAERASVNAYAEADRIAGKKRGRLSGLVVVDPDPAR